MTTYINVMSNGMMTIESENNPLLVKIICRRIIKQMPAYTEALTKGVTVRLVVFYVNDDMYRYDMESEELKYLDDNCKEVVIKQ